MATPVSGAVKAGVSRRGLFPLVGAVIVTTLIFFFFLVQALVHFISPRVNIASSWRPGSAASWFTSEFGRSQTAARLRTSPDASPP
jgi:hypothetical protein